MSATPHRIVCLSADAADWLCRLGAWDGVVGVTAFFVPLPGAATKPRVSGFNSANLEQITRLRPDLVITFSDVQAAFSAELIRQGISVLATNQRTLTEVESTLALLARVVDREPEGERLLQAFRERLAPVSPVKFRPRVYFEEWNAPLISGIAWVSELIERAGGQDVFAGLREEPAADGRLVTGAQVRQADPEIILASWCGKPVDLIEIPSRPGWSTISAVRHHRVYELPSSDVLQPGFRLIYGYERIKQLLEAPACVAALSH